MQGRQRSQRLQGGKLVAAQVQMPARHPGKEAQNNTDRPMQQNLQHRQSRFKGHMKATLKSVVDLDIIFGSEVVSRSVKKTKQTLIWL